MIAPSLEQCGYPVVMMAWDERLPPPKGTSFDTPLFFHRCGVELQGNRRGRRISKAATRELLQDAINFAVAPQEMGARLGLPKLLSRNPRADFQGFLAGKRRAAKRR
jgi:hypothetical protein